MIHGGDIYNHRVKIDFSVNVNPLGIPAAIKRAMHRAVGHCMEYPDIQAAQCRRMLGRRYTISEDAVLCGNGASELFLAIVHGIRPKKIWIPVPSFGGYEYAAEAAGSQICYFPLRREEQFRLTEQRALELLEKMAIEDTKQTNMLFLANPNNPVGNLTESHVLKRLVEECISRNTVAVIDECFLEFTGREEESMLNQLERYPNLIVVRALTKSYAIPGARFGYLFCQNPDWIRRISTQLPEWNLSAFAQAAGAAMEGTQAYLKRTVKLVQKERNFLSTELEQSGIKVFPSESNFLLLQSEVPLYEALLQKGLLIRQCVSFRGLEEGYYRIAVRRHRENRKLIREIKRILSEV